MHLPFLRPPAKKLSRLVHLPFLEPWQKLSRVFGGHVVKCRGQKRKNKGLEGWFQKQKEGKFQLFAGALSSLALPRTGTYLRNGPVFIRWYPTHFGADPFKFTFMLHLLCLVPALLLSNMSSPFNLLNGSVFPSFPSHTNFSNCGSNQCWCN